MALNEHGLTPKQEKFAQGIGSGLSQAEAYRKAYPSSLKWLDNTVWSRASVMAKNKKVVARVTTLREKASEIVGLTSSRIVEEIQKIAFSNIQGITKPDGALKLPHELDPATAAAIASFEIDQYGGVKYKFWDKNASLEKLAKHKGIYEKDNDQKTPKLIGTVRLVPLEAEDDE